MTGPHIHHVEARAKRRPTRQFVSETHEHRPDDGAQIYAGIRTMLDRICARDAEARERVRAEIRTNGTAWAADEITRLRADLARCRRELRDAAAKGGAT